MEFALKSGVHYVEVNSPEEVRTKLAWLRAHQHEAKKISDAARAWMVPFANRSHDRTVAREVLRHVAQKLRAAGAAPHGNPQESHERAEAHRGDEAAARQPTGGGAGPSAGGDGFLLGALWEGALRFFADLFRSGGGLPRRKYRIQPVAAARAAQSRYGAAPPSANPQESLTGDRAAGRRAPPRSGGAHGLPPANKSGSVHTGE